MGELLLAWPRLPVAVALGLAALATAFPAPLARLLERVDVHSPKWKRAIGALLLAVTGVVALTFTDYGYNVDEGYQEPYGITLVNWWFRLLGGGGFAEFQPAHPFQQYYGGFFETGAELAARFSPLDRTTTRHLVTALFGVAGLGGVAWLGCILHSRAAGFLTALLLVLTPRFYGHFYANSKDLPFAVCTVFLLVALCGALPHLPRLSSYRVRALGATLGACLGIRVVGGIGFAYLGLAMAWWAGGEIRRGRRGPELRSDLLAAALRFGAVTAVAWVVMLLSWPWALAAPFRRPFEALGFFNAMTAQKTTLDFELLFDGRLYRLTNVPAHYSLEWLAISLPEFWLLAPLVVWAVVRWWRTRSAGWPSAREMAWILIATSVVVPLTVVSFGNGLRHGATRHLLFLVPGLTAALAASLVHFLTGPRNPRLRAGVGVALGLLAAITLLDMRSLHPYQYVYFNRSVLGALPSAVDRYEIDNLGLSHREGMRWLVEHHAELAPGGRAPRPGEKLRVAACPGFFSNAFDAVAQVPGADARFEVVNAHEQPDLVLASTRQNCHRRQLGRQLATIDRMGTPLLYVFERKR